MRLFIGIEPSDEIRSALTSTIENLSAEFPARYVRGDMLHLTLAFIGNAEENDVGSIANVMDKFASDTAPFDISLGKAGYFGNPQNAILYCGTEASSVLDSAASALRHALDCAGIPFDPQPFKPHITLARKFDALSFMESVKMPHGCFRAGTATLFHSHRVDDVLVYEPIHRAVFKGGTSE